MPSQRDRLEPQSAVALDRFDAFKDQWREAIEAGGMPISREYAHRVFTHFRHRERDLEPPAIENLRIATRHGEIAARRYCGSKDSATSGFNRTGTAMFMHGGGWSLGGLDAYDGLVGSLAALSGFDFINLDYALAPEHPFPIALEQCSDALEKLAERVKDAPLVVIGDSAGGNLAAVLARKAAERGYPRLAAQVLIYPMTDIASPDSAYASRRDYGDGSLFLENEGIENAALAYVGERIGLRSSPLVSPLYGAIPESLAPALFITAQLDPLRDEAVAYHDRLRAAGVDSVHREYSGTFHAFASFGELDRAQQARRDIAEYLREL